MTTFALGIAALLLAAAVPIIVGLARRTLYQDGLIALLEANAIAAAELEAQQRRQIDSLNDVLDSQRNAIKDQGELTELYASRNEWLEQLIIQYITSRPPMTTPRIMRIEVGSVEMN